MLSAVFPCEYCSARLVSLQGLRSHQRAQYAPIVSDSESDEPELPDNTGDILAPSLDDPMHSDEDLIADPPLEIPEDDNHSRAGSLPPADLPRPPKRPRATVEEVEDEDNIWIQDFPEKSGAGKRGAECETPFEKHFREQKDEGHEPWHPFQSEDEWNLAQWLMTSGVSQSKRDEFLKLKVIREGCKPSFHNNRAFLKFIDALPRGPAWHCQLMELTGDEVDEKGVEKKEVVELWYRDPLDCIRELLGNPAFRDKQGFAPRRIFRSPEKKNREYSEMWTASWWWEIQKLLPPGATLGPILISSNKTQLTRLSGDQQAWPVYLTIGNIDMETRPPLKVAGEEGVEMECADGFVRMMYPILAAYIADYPEQCLVACCRENSCPRCLVAPRSRGDTADAPWRNPTETLGILYEQAHGTRPPEFLPHCDIFTCFTPDLLHEIHNGVFGDHLVSWCSNTFPDGRGESEIDSRFRAMTPHSSLRHFKKGISLTSQWTGNEHKNMEKVFLGVIADTTDPAIQRAAKGALDFIYYSHFEIHSDKSLSQMDVAWDAFHSNKQIFIDLDVRKNFDINKLHKLKHYTNSIRSRSTAAGFNTEATERLHIDLAKVGYKATNKKAYIQQMATWLRRQEAVQKFGAYLQWAVPGYIAQPAVPEDKTEQEDADAGEDEDADDPDPNESVPAPGFSLRKTAHFPSLTAASISTNFHAPDFLYNLTKFLHSNSITAPVDLTEESTFPVYKNVGLTLPVIPEVTRHTVQDKVRAAKGDLMKITPSGIRPSTPGRFDTVLVRTRKREEGASPIDGLGVARVRVIFKLPEHHGNYADPLVYIDWFKPLTTPVTNLGMYCVSLSTRMHHQKSEIIPITQIVRSCHLIPRFGRRIDPTWNSENVLDCCKEFYLNPYLRHHDFFLFPYSAEAERMEREHVRIRLIGRAGRD
ncbi:hypothetical protein K438DRAFT_1911066 [Mycena galopus ATCC 62051]|nr:hypothetical protein K438DRAFT_1911066 [Mycena galopus ATCC 62051]